MGITGVHVSPIFTNYFEWSELPQFPFRTVVAEACRSWRAMVFFLLEKCVSNSIAESVQILTFSWVLVTGSDYDRDEALESVVPSAKETATQLMEAAMDALAKDLAKLRTGRASPGTLQNLHSVALTPSYSSASLNYWAWRYHSVWLPPVDGSCVVIDF